VPRAIAWTLAARQDLLSAIQYLVDQAALDPAGRLLEGIEVAAASLGDFPERGRIVPELGPPRRELIVMDHRLVYRVRLDSVEVLRLIHGRRDFLSAWRRDTR
jgi:plasmid stabilization system protein ParE